MSTPRDNVNRGKVRRTLDTASYVNELTMRSNALAMRLEQFRDFILDDPRGVDDSVVREISTFIAYLRHLDLNLTNVPSLLHAHLTRNAPLPHVQHSSRDEANSLIARLRELLAPYQHDD
jgi:hypothetical protein